MLRAKRQLKSNVLKRALNVYIVAPFVRKYNVVSVRSLWNENDKVWSKRREVENVIRQMDNVVAFFSCITVMEKGPQKRKLNEKGKPYLLFISPLHIYSLIFR